MPTKKKSATKKKKAAPKKKKVSRSSVSGRFVKRDYAKRNPKTTENEEL